MTERGPFHPAVPKNDPEYDQARENLLTVLADIDAYDGHREKIEEMVKQYTCQGSKSENREENVEIFREHFGLTASGERRSYLDVGLDHNLSAAPDDIEEAVRDCEGTETLEIGCNKHACTKYAYDPYVKADNAINLTWEEVMQKKFDLVVIKNAINYLSPQEIYDLFVAQDCPAKRFIANTFCVPPEEKIGTDELAVKMQRPEHRSLMLHGLRLKDDSIMRHEFYAYTEEYFRSMGFRTKPYGKNSMLVFL